MRLVFLILLSFSSRNVFGHSEKKFNRDWVLKVIKQEHKSYSSCYDDGLKINPELEGRVVVDFEIGSDGTVQKAKVGSSTLNNKIVENCLIEKIKTFKFHTPPKKTIVEIKFPFDFKKVKKVDSN